jgi:hypothetical protein
VTRQITINAAKFTAPPTSTFKVATMTGTTTTLYTVGTYNNGTFTAHPSAANGSIITQALSPGDTPVPTLQAIIAAIVTAEQLVLAANGGTDVILDEDGDQIA